QGISWQRVAIVGEANHAGTTPMRMRRDAGHVAARIINLVNQLAMDAAPDLVATVGSISFAPGAINVVPGEAVLTLDMRSPEAGLLALVEKKVAELLDQVRQEGFEISTTQLAQTPPVHFDETIVGIVEEAARGRGLSVRRMTSGAGHD